MLKREQSSVVFVGLAFILGTFPLSRLFSPAENDLLYFFANTPKVLVDIKVAEAKHFQIERIHCLFPRGIACHPFVCIVLGAVKFYHKPRFGAIEVGYVVHDDHLPVELHRIVPKEPMPESVFLSCCIVPQFSRKLP